jgi:hypothetical protein
VHMSHQTVIPTLIDIALPSFPGGLRKVKLGITNQ